MIKTGNYTLCLAMIASAVMFANPVRGAEDRERQLIDVLQSDAPRSEKAITCKYLAIYGTADAVPALGALLPDEELESWVRIALEAIPDSAADDALCEAMNKLSGRSLIGVINSIGVRRSPGAVEGLTRRLNDPDPDVASVAAVALGRIGGDSAAKALEQSMAGAPPSVRSAIAEGCILCAERLLAAGDATAAAQLYDQVRKGDLPKQRIIEATRGAILARKSEGIPLLVEQFQSPDRGLFAIGLSTSRELPGRDVTEALVAQMAKLSPPRQGLLLLALADRDDSAVLPAVLQAAQGGPKDVRIVALDALPQVGDVTCVPAVLNVALEADAELSDAAKMALVDLPGEDVDTDVVARLGQAEGQARNVLIEVAGRRRIAAATPALIQAADDFDPQTRSDALMALGATIGPENLSVLIQRVVTPRPTQDWSAAQLALHAACIRMPDREACAEQLAAAMSGAPVAAQHAVVEILGAMGGTNALRSVAAAAKSDNPELQDVASRLLGEWMTVDAAPALLDLAKTAPEAKYQVRAMRGYIRIARQFVLPNHQRAEMCRAALGTATRDAEKRLVLEVMERYPSREMLQLAVEATKNPALKEQAADVSLVIAQKIGGTGADVQKLLAQIGQEPVKVEIIKAEYGAGNRFKDVTETLRRHVRDLPVVILPSSNYNASFGGDPVPGTVKQLKVKYRINGREGEVSFSENESVVLPVPEDRN